MNISLLISDIEHPVYQYLVDWKNRNCKNHNIDLLSKKSDLKGGDVLFLISFSEILEQEFRSLYPVVFVIHASNLPEGRGWSPHIWRILEGKNDITVTIFKAEEKLDSGDIWAQESIQYEGHELYDEINTKLFEVTINLIDFVVNNIGSIKPRKQDENKATYFPRRTPQDSRIDPEKTIASQFDLLRISDTQRYPAFLDFRGHRYIISISKAEKYLKD